MYETALAPFDCGCTNCIFERLITATMSNCLLQNEQVQKSFEVLMKNQSKSTCREAVAINYEKSPMVNHSTIDCLLDKNEENKTKENIRDHLVTGC